MQINQNIGSPSLWRNVIAVLKDLISEPISKAVANDIPMKILEPAPLTDGAIALAAAYEIDLMTSIPSGILEITVEQGRVTLEGAVEWDYQQTAAGNAVRYLAGVKEVKNLIRLRPPG